MSWGKYRKTQNVFISDKKKIRKVDNDGNEDIIAISHKIKLM